MKTARWLAWPWVIESLRPLKMLQVLLMLVPLLLLLLQLLQLQLLLMLQVLVQHMLWRRLHRYARQLNLLL